MSDFQGRFVWYELMTTDAVAAAAFYRRVVGWTARDMSQPGMPYTILGVGDYGVGGLFQLTKEHCDAGGKPGWIGYIAVDDVDAIAARLVKAGGTVHKQPADIPHVGRFAMVADPEGTGFVLFKPIPPPVMSAPPPEGTPGTFGWRELIAADWERMFPFYESLFGWKKQKAMPMGPLGVYQTYSASSGEEMGGMMTRPPNNDAVLPGWTFYTNVDDIRAAAARVKDAGGTVLNEPMEVPGSRWIIVCRDPQGAHFALLAPR